MFSQEQDYYVRFILLLIQGGTALLRGIAKKALGKMNKSFVDFLTSVKTKLEKTRDLSNKQKSKLYPGASQEVDMDCLDISLISYLINHFLQGFLEHEEIVAVTEIRDLRNKYHAHTTETKMTFNAYIKAWTKLVTTITKISSGMSEEEQGSLNDIIDNVVDSPLTMNTLTTKFNMLDEEKELFFESIIKGMEGIRQDQRQMFEEVKDAHKDLLDMKMTLAQLKDNLENQGKTTAKEYTIYARIEVCANNHKAADHAAIALLEVSKDIISKTELKESKEEGNESQRGVKETMRKVVEDIDQFGIKVETVKKGSIEFELKCDSLTQILDLLDYFTSPRLQNRLDEVALALEEIIQQKIWITGFIDSHSIQNIIAVLQEEEHKTVVQMKLTCIGIDGMRNALEVFEEGRVSNSFNELSRALTEVAGVPVTLHTSLDLHQMQTSIVSIRNQLKLDVAVDTEVSSPEKSYHLRNEEELKSEIRQEASALEDQAGTKLDETSLDILLQSTDNNSDQPPRKRKKTLITEICDDSSRLDEAKLSKEDLEVIDGSSKDSLQAYERSTEVKHTLKQGDEAMASTSKSGYLVYESKSDRCSLEQPAEISKGHQGPSCLLSLTHEYDIDGSTETDTDICGITGSVILPCNRMALADMKNYKIKIVDLQKLTVVKERKFKFAPCDVTALPGDRIATTLSNNKEIVIMNIDDQMSVVSSENINRKCWGISFHDNLIYVVCWNPSSVLVLDIEGTVLREISLENARHVKLSYPRSIALNDKVQHLCVSDFNGNFIVQVTLCEMTLVQQYVDLKYPQGMVMLEDGALLVCCWSGSLFHISADLTHIKRLTKHVPKARSVCYQPSSRKVYVSSHPGNLISVFTLN